MAIEAVCKAQAIGPIVYSSSSPQYCSPECQDWMSVLFEQKHRLEPQAKGRISFTDWAEFPFYDTPHKLTVQGCAAVFAETFKISGSIQEKIERIESQIIRPCVAIHYRSTDKKAEAPEVPVETCIDSISRVIELWPDCRSLYIATDSTTCLTKLQEAFKDRILVISQTDCMRSADDTAVHTQMTGNGIEKASSALIDCIILSRSDFLLRSASLLSGWASILNTELCFFMLNHPYPGKSFFPDSELSIVAHGKNLDDCILAAKAKWERV